GWGFAAAPDPVLLYVRGFDPAAARFRYAVNGRFGASSAGNGGVTVPFQIGLQARLTLGPDRLRDRLRASDRRASAGPDSAAATPDLGSLASARQPLANPIARIMSFRDSLGLSAEQIAALHAIADSLDVRSQSMQAALCRALGAAGLAGDSGARVPPLLAWDHDLRVLVIGWLEGPTTHELVKQGQGRRAGELAAQWLRRTASLQVKLGLPFGAAGMMHETRAW